MPHSSHKKLWALEGYMIFLLVLDVTGTSFKLQQLINKSIKSLSVGEILFLSKTVSYVIGLDFQSKIFRQGIGLSSVVRNLGIAIMIWCAKKFDPVDEYFLCP